LEKTCGVFESFSTKEHTLAFPILQEISMMLMFFIRKTENKYMMMTKGFGEMWTNKFGGGGK